MRFAVTELFVSGMQFGSPNNTDCNQVENTAGDQTKFHNQVENMPNYKVKKNTVGENTVGDQTKLHYQSENVANDEINTAGDQTENNVGSRKENMKSNYSKTTGSDHAESIIAKSTADNHPEITVGEQTANTVDQRDGDQAENTMWGKMAAHLVIK